MRDRSATPIRMSNGTRAMMVQSAKSGQRGEAYVAILRA